MGPGRIPTRKLFQPEPDFFQITLIFNYLFFHSLFFLQYTKESLEIELRFLLFFFFSSSWSFIHDKLVFLFRQPLRRPPLLTSEVSHRYFCSFFFLVRECAVKIINAFVFILLHVDSEKL